MIVSPAEDLRLHKLEKSCKSFQFGTTAEIAGNMAFLFQIIRNLKSELERRDREKTP